MSEHRECIEVETDYDRGVMDERKRWEERQSKFDLLKNAVLTNRVDSIFESNTHGDDKYYCPYCGEETPYKYRYVDGDMNFIIHKDNCAFSIAKKYHEPKGSE